MAILFLRRTCTEVSLGLFLAKWNPTDSNCIGSLDLVYKAYKPYTFFLERH